MQTEHTQIFEEFSTNGKLLLPHAAVSFGEIAWSKHPTFEGVELKHIVTANQTGGQFSFHLVRIAPHCSIGLHVHKTQLETHEVIAGSGTCLNDGVRLAYKPGVVSIFPANLPHEVSSGADGLQLFAKFMPALL